MNPSVNILVKDRAGSKVKTGFTLLKFTWHHQYETDKEKSLATLEWKGQSYY